VGQEIEALEKLGLKAYAPGLAEQTGFMISLSVSFMQQNQFDYAYIYLEIAQLLSDVGALHVLAQQADQELARVERLLDEYPRNDPASREARASLSAFRNWLELTQEDKKSFPSWSAEQVQGRKKELENIFIKTSSIAKSLEDAMAAPDADEPEPKPERDSSESPNSDDASDAPDAPDADEPPVDEREVYKPPF
jgi:hypothetical protein